jgi:diguanylate cyclase (GGDEF)-like protein
MSGLDAGRVVALDHDETVIGRDPGAHVWVADPAVSWRHARIAREARGAIVLHDLDSTNGTFLDGERVAGSAVLQAGQQIHLGPTFRARFGVGDTYEESFQRALYNSSVRDALTGLFNRRYFDQRLASELAHAHRRESALAVLLIDIDHFKQLNDKHGHQAGDDALRILARDLGRVVRSEDVLARWGGDEFIAIAREATRDDATQLGERLRSAARSAWVRSGEIVVSTTVSIGLATLSDLRPDEGPSDLIARADERLYGAKLAGRDCVCAQG